jgi:hypothetical protein
MTENGGSTGGFRRQLPVEPATARRSTPEPASVAAGEVGYYSALSPTARSCSGAGPAVVVCAERSY